VVSCLLELKFLQTQITRKENERNTMIEEIGELKKSVHIPIA
jgi:hypothetical protein